MSILSYNQINELFNQVAIAHYQIKRFGSGELSEADINKFISENQEYPVLWMTPVSVTTNSNVLLYSLNLLVFDLVNKDKDNEREVLSDCLQIALDVVRILRYGNAQFNIVTEPTISPFAGRYSDWVAGWSLEIELEVDLQENNCDIPYDGLDLTQVLQNFVPISEPGFECIDLEGCELIINLQSDVSTALNNTITGGTYNSGTTNITLTTLGGTEIVITGITAGGGTPILLQTNGETNETQNILNFVEGLNTTISDDGEGNITFNSLQTNGIKTLLAGGAEWSGIGLIFDISELTYTFTGEILNAGPTSITLSSGDTSNPRIDAIVVDEEGNITVIEGTPSPDPATPAIPEDQLLVQYVIIQAGATTPNITQEFIYLENTEWTTTTYQTSGVPFGSVNLASSTPPAFEGLVCINSNTDQRTGIRFTRVSPIDISQYSLLTLRVWIDTPIATNKSLLANLLLSGVTQGVTVNLNTLGFNRNLTGQWQQIIVPVLAFGAVSNIDRLQIRLNGTPNNVAVQYALDYIQLQTGIAPPSFQNEIIVEYNGAPIGSRPRINFIPSGNTTILAVDDVINDRVNITISSSGGTVTSVTDDGNGVCNVDNTDPSNPIIGFNGVYVDGTTITGDGTIGNPLKATLVPGKNLVLYLDSPDQTWTATALSGDILTSAIETTQTTVTSTDNGNTRNVINFISGPDFFESTIIPDGFWLMHLFGSRNSGTVSFYTDIYYVDNDGVSNKTLITSGAGDPVPITNTVPIMLSQSLFSDVISLSDTNKRLIIEVFVITGSGNRTTTFYFRDSTISHIHTPLTAPSGSGTTFTGGTVAGPTNFTGGLTANTFSATTYLGLPEDVYVTGGTFNGSQIEFTNTSGGTFEVTGFTNTTGGIATWSQGANGSVVSGTTSNSVTYTQLISGGTMGNGNLIRTNWKCRWQVSSQVVMRMYINTTPDLTGTPILAGTYNNGGAISFRVNSMLRTLVVKDASSSTETYLAAGATPTDLFIYNDISNLNVDWTVDQYFIFALQHTVTSQVSYGSFYLIEKI